MKIPLSKERIDSLVNALFAYEDDGPDRLSISLSKYLRGVSTPKVIYKFRFYPNEKGMEAEYSRHDKDGDKEHGLHDLGEISVDDFVDFVFEQRRDGCWVYIYYPADLGQNIAFGIKTMREGSLWDDDPNLAELFVLGEKEDFRRTFKAFLEGVGPYHG